MENKMETIKCAAIKRADGIIIAGRNHGFVIQHSPYGTCKKNSEQGFLTSKARFVNRKEAARIAFKVKQIKKPIDMLFSEDITGDWPWAGEITDKLQVENDQLKAQNKSLKEFIKETDNKEAYTQWCNCNKKA